MVRVRANPDLGAGDVGGFFHRCVGPGEVGGVGLDDEGIGFDPSQGLRWETERELHGCHWPEGWGGARRADRAG